MCKSVDCDSIAS